MLNNKQKQLQLLGLATRARLLASGEEIVLSHVRSKQATLVLVAHDCSLATKKKIKDKCLHYNVPYHEKFSSDEISQAIGKSRGICAFIDQGFAKSFLSKEEIQE